MSSKTTPFTIMLSLVILSVNFTIATCHLGDLNQTITIPLHNRTSQKILAHVIGRLLQESGYTVQFENITPAESFKKMQTGAISFNPEIWPNQKSYKAFKSSLMNGNIVSAGRHAAEDHRGLWAPSSTLRKCSYIADKDGLNRCVQTLSPKKRLVKGVIFTNSSVVEMENIISKHGLDYDVQLLESSDESKQALKNALKSKRPVLFDNWGPGPHLAHDEGLFIKLPKEVHPKLEKASWYLLPEQNPCAYKLLQSVSLTDKQLSEISNYMNKYHVEAHIAARVWINQNPDIWKPWLASFPKI